MKIKDLDKKKTYKIGNTTIYYVGEKNNPITDDEGWLVCIQPNSLYDYCEIMYRDLDLWLQKAILKEIEKQNKTNN